MKKAFKISAVLVALVVIAAMALVFTSSAADVGTIEAFQEEIAKDGATVVLTADIGTPNDQVVFNVAGNVTIDLNGHKIYSGVTGGLFLQQGVALPGTLTIKDSVGGGAIIAPTATLFDNVGGTVKITAGTYVATGFVVTGDDKVTPVITISGTDSDTKGTWTSFDPSSALVYGYSVKNAPSKVDATAVNCVYPTVYTITYTVPNGATHTNILQYTVETDTIHLVDATAPGYVFKGWYVKENGVEQAINYVNTKTHLYDLEVVGKFEAKVYNINYAGEGYTNNPNNPATFTVDKANIKLGAPTKAGYQFLGWFTQPNGAGEQVTEIKCSTTFEDVTVYPAFEAIVYQITYVTYIEGFDENTLKHDYTVEDEFEFGKVNKVGYTFIGWYNSAIPSEDDEAIPGIKKGTTGNIIVYAQYEIVNYKINYGEADEIVSDYAEFPKEYNIETPTFALPTPEVKPGYSFIGWKDATDTIISIVPVGSVGDLDLEPVIEKTQYKIFYVFGTGLADSSINNAANADKIYFTITDEVRLASPTRAYYDFVAWCTADPTGVEDIDAFVKENSLAKDETTGEWIIPAGTTSNVYVYAVWTPTKYDITYDEDGYAFQIKVDANGIPELDDNGDIQYVLDAEGNKIPVDLDDKGVLPEDAITYYTYTADAKLPIPTRDGYEFQGWLDATTGKLLTPDANGEIIIAKGTRTGALKLTAEWKIKKYTVTLKYQFNDDYYGVNKADIDNAFGSRTFWEETYDVVFSTSFTHEVQYMMDLVAKVTNSDTGVTEEFVFTTNGFVPTQWFVKVDSMPSEDVEIIVYFEPVVKSTVYENGVLTVTYHDGTQKKIDIASVNGIKLEGNALIYTSANGDSTTVGSFVTAADFAKLEETVKSLNESLAKLQASVTNGDEALQKQIDAIKADLATKATDLTAALEDITTIKGQIEALQSAIDALEAKDTTYLILIIIIGIIAVGAAAGVVVVFVKKK